MKTSFFIALRYIFSKNNKQAVNLITWFSVSGLAVGTAALVIVMSVMNGFEDLISGLYQDFDPDIVVVSSHNKYFNSNDKIIDNCKSMEGVKYAGFVCEENVMLKYGNKQYFATLKGISTDRFFLSGIKNHLLYEGENLKNYKFQEAIVGSGIASFLNINPEQIALPLSISVPEKNADINTPEYELFNTLYYKVEGIFSIQQEFDTKYILLPYEQAVKLTDNYGKATAIEIILSDSKSLLKTQKKLQEKLGNNFKVMNKYEIHATSYKILKSEKWAVFFILLFIIIISAFNITGTLTMLLIEKSRDIFILKSMGMSVFSIKSIFLTNGILVTLLGMLSGFLLGILMCYLQIHYGLIKLSTSDSFIIQFYPIKIVFLDIILILFVAFAIGLFASVLPLGRISSKVFQAANFKS